MGMKEQSTISTVLESEHRWIDERFQRFRQHLSEGQVDAALFEEAAKVLHRHIYLEEEIVFSELEARGMQGPPDVMAQEHGEICRFLNRILELVHGNTSPGQVQGVFNALVSLLEEHNFKEEKILYPAADRLLDSSQVVRQMEKESPPSGWVCRAHRSGE